MARKPKSGGHPLYLFNVVQEDPGGGLQYVIKNADKSGDAASAADALYVFEGITGAQPKPQEDGTINLSLTNYHGDAALDAILKAHARAKVTGAGITLPDLTWIDGDTYSASSGASGDNDELCIIYPSFLDKDTGKIRTWLAMVTIDKTSGGSDDKGDAHSVIDMSFKSYFGDFDLDIAAALFPTSIFAVPGAAQSVTTDYAFEIVHLDKAA